MNEEMNLSRMSSPLTGLIQDEEGTVSGKEVADWLVKNSIVSDIATSADAILRLVDCGQLERVWRDGETARIDVFQARYSLVSQNHQNENSTTQQQNNGIGWVSFLNPRSGGHRAKGMYKELLEILPKERVCNVTIPSELRRGVIEWECNRTLKVLICGGDGTIRWIMDAFDTLPNSQTPIFGIVPMGIGNDLGVAFGWKCLKNKKANRILSMMDSAIAVKMDRWDISVRQQQGIQYLSATMNNYFSIGTDAKACKWFHNLRNKAPSLFPNVCIGKTWYTFFGVTANCERIFSSEQNTSLNESINLIVDGIKITIPEHIAAIAVVSTPTIYGGIKAWKSANNVSSGDGIVEIIAVKGAFHMFGMITHLASTMKLARGSIVDMSFKKQLDAQIDGEPFLMPSEIKVTIKRKSQVRVLRK